MKIAVIGTGAVGGFYGILLAKSGYDLHFLLNSDFQHVCENGLKLTSKTFGDTHLPNVNAYKNAHDMPICDIVLVTLKTTMNALLPEILPHICTNQTSVLVLQNGLDTDQDVYEIVPRSKIYGGLCSLAANKIAPGHIKHVSYNTIRLGSFLSNKKDTGISQELIQLASIFEHAGITIETTSDITDARWRKLCWNIPFNGLTTILRLDTSCIVANTSTRELVYKLIQEIITIADSSGKRIEKEYAEEMLSLTDKMGPYKPSTMLDFLAERPMEIEHIFKRPLQVALTHKLKVPYLAMLVAQVDILSQSINKNAQVH
jgi:2-dehydropantoate 2-reductase